MARARVYVTLKKSVFDPQGKTIHDALGSLGYSSVTDVRQGKFFELDLAPGVPAAEARRTAEEIARQGAGEPGDRELPGGGGAMKVGVVVFPGSNCDHDTYHVVKHVLGQEAAFVWHKDGSTCGDVDAVILPGGFAYGDYLRTGAVARFSPIMRAVTEFAGKGGPVLGICNGFQILQEAGLLPGAMLRNKTVQFLSAPVHVRVERDGHHRDRRRSRGGPSSPCPSPTARATSTCPITSSTGWRARDRWCSAT